MNCADPWHKQDRCATCGLEDTGYDRGYREAATLDVERLDDHVPSGGEGMDGYGYVECSCGWGDWLKPTWVEHLRAALHLTDAVSSGQHG